MHLKQGRVRCSSVVKSKSFDQGWADLVFLAGYSAELSGMPCRILLDIQLFLTG